MGDSSEGKKGTVKKISHSPQRPLSPHSPHSPLGPPVHNVH